MPDSRIAGTAMTDATGTASRPVSTSAGSHGMPQSVVTWLKVAAIGDSDFASNGWLGIQGNQDLFLNTVGWLAQQESLISIRPRDPEDRRLTLSAQAQRNVAYLAWLGIPGAVFVLGVWSWRRRRG